MDALNGLRSDFQQFSGLLQEFRNELGRGATSASSPDCKDLPNTNRKGVGSIVSESEAFRPRPRGKS